MVPTVPTVPTEYRDSHRRGHAYARTPARASRDPVSSFGGDRGDRGDRECKPLHDKDLGDNLPVPIRFNAVGTGIPHSSED
jgi:hypothetical protein